MKGRYNCADARVGRGAGLCNDTVEELAAGHELENHIYVAAALVNIQELDAVGVIDKLHNINFTVNLYKRL
jgi:hypothetical protein